MLNYFMDLNFVDPWSFLLCHSYAEALWIVIISHQYAWNAEKTDETQRWALDIAIMSCYFSFYRRNDPMLQNRGRSFISRPRCTGCSKGTQHGTFYLCSCMASSFFHMPTAQAIACEVQSQSVRLLKRQPRFKRVDNSIGSRYCGQCNCCHTYW